MQVPDVSALYKPRHIHLPERTTLLGWEIDSDTFPPDNPTHPCFDSESGVYTVPNDGLYLINVQLIPIGAPNLYSDRHTRKSVVYAVCLHTPSATDEIESRFLDVGSFSFGQIEHLAKGTRVSCIRFPSGLPNDCVRFRVELVIRKRRREEVEISKKELKKRRKKKKKDMEKERKPVALNSPLPFKKGPQPIESEDDDDSDSDSEWEHGFESDSTSDELLHSAKGVRRLAKRFKASSSNDIHS